MGFPTDLVLATRNPGKVREIMRICSSWPVTWHLGTDPSDPSRLPGPWPEVEETGETYLDNARLKAHAVAEALGLPAVGEDSGIEVDALGGEPGPRSARYAGPNATDTENLELLITKVRPVPPESRTARYRCLAVCAWPDGREVWAEGDCEGTLIVKRRGKAGFGYDPIFVPAGERRTMAELSPDEKNALSHRAKALRALGEILSRSSP